MMMFAYQQSRKTNDYATKHALQRKKFQVASRLQHRQPKPQNPESTNPAGNPAGNPAQEPAGDASTEKITTATPFKGILNSTGQYAISPDASSSDGSLSTSTGINNDTGREIIKILNHHTSLLEKLYGVEHRALEFEKDQAAKNMAAMEERNLETQGESYHSTKITIW